MSTEPTDIQVAKIQTDLEYIKKKLDDLSIDFRKLAESTSSLRNDLNIANGSIISINQRMVEQDNRVSKLEASEQERQITFRNIKLLLGFVLSSNGIAIVLWLVTNLSNIIK